MIFYRNRNTIKYWERFLHLPTLCRSFSCLRKQLYLIYDESLCKPKSKNIPHSTWDFVYQLIKYQCYPHIETSQLICCANQLTSFYRTATLAFDEFKRGWTNFYITNGSLWSNQWSKLIETSDKNITSSFGFLIFSGGIERDQWNKTGQLQF